MALTFIQGKQLGPEDQGSMDAIAQKQRMAQILAQQAMAAPQVAAGGALPSWAPIVQALQGYMAGTAHRSANEGQQKLLAADAENTNAQLQGMLQARQTQVSGPQFDGTGSEVDDIAPYPKFASGGPQSEEYKNALIGAMTNPRLAKVAEEELKNFNAGRITPKDLMGRASLSSVQANPNDFTKWQGKDNQMIVGDQIFNAPEGQAPKHSGGQSWASPFRGPDGQLYQNAELGGQIKPLDTGVKVTNTLSTGAQKSGAEAYFKAAAAQVDSLGKQAYGAQGMLESLSNLQELDKQGIFSNATSGPATFLANVGQVLGMPVDTAKLGNTETYGSEVERLRQGLISGMEGGNRGVTAEEAKQIAKMLPLSSHSPEARATITQIIARAANRTINQYQQANQALADAVAADDPRIWSQRIGNIYIAPEVRQPKAPTAAPTAKPIGGGQVWNPRAKRFE